MDEYSLTDKIAAVINDHLAEICDAGMMTGFVFAMDYIDEDGGTSWLHAQSRDQPVTSTIGMLRWYTLYVEDTAIKAMHGELDD